MRIYEAASFLGTGQKCSRTLRDPRLLRAIGVVVGAEDQDGDKVYLAESAFSLRWAADKNPELKFTDVKTIRTG